MSRQFSGTSGAGGTIVPAEAGLWNYAVPTSNYQREAASTNGIQQNSQNPRPRQPLSTNSNGNMRPKTRGTSKSIDGLNQAYATSGVLKPPIKEQGGASGGTSDADSLLDLYRPSKDSSRATSRERPRVKRKGSRGSEVALRSGPQEDIDKWIHRDKLQQIEIQEMIAAGRGFDLPSRSASKSSPKSPELATGDLGEGAKGEYGTHTGHDNKRQRLKSSPLSSEGQREETEHFPEIAGAMSGADQPTPAPSYQTRRPSTSRIPIKKGGSISDEPDSIPTSDDTRAMRSGSQSSQNMLDMAQQTPTSATRPQFGNSPQGSPRDAPAKQRAPSKTATATRGRNVSRGGRAPSGPTSPRSASSGALSRPQTSGGSRPITANPEDDPFGTMFKPDPRLPPDQQMLPTHARRLALERQTQQAFDPNSSPRKHDDLVLLDDENQPGQAYGNEVYEPRDGRYDHHRAVEESHPGTYNSTSKTSSPQIDQNSPMEARKRDSLRGDGRGSPNVPTEQENGQWPLRGLTINKFAGDQPEQASPKTDTGSWTTTRPNVPSDSGSYSLMPAIHGQKEMEQRMSQRSGLSNPGRDSTHSSVMQGFQMAPQTVRVPEEPEPSEKDKKKGCLGCCVVM